LYRFPVTVIASYLSNVMPILTYPTCIWCPCWRWNRSNFAEFFGVWKLSPWALITWF